MGVVFSVDGGAEEWLGMFPYYNRKTPGLAPASILYMQVKFFQVLQREKRRLLYALYSTLPPLYMVRGGRTRDKKENIEGRSNTAFEN